VHCLIMIEVGGYPITITLQKLLYLNLSTRITGAPYRVVNSKGVTIPKLKVEDKANSRRIKW